MPEAQPEGEICLTGERFGVLSLSLIMFSTLREFNGHIAVASNALLICLAI